MDMDSKTKTYGYILLDTIGREVEAADGEHRRLSLECLCRAMAVDVVLATGYFGETLTAISRLLAKPTEKQIARSYERWKEFHHQQHSQELQEEYDQWKVQYPPRLLKSRLCHQGRLSLRKQGSTGSRLR